MLLLSHMLCQRILTPNYPNRMAGDQRWELTGCRRQSPPLPLLLSLLLLPPASTPAPAPLARKAAFSASTQRAYSAAVEGSSRSMPRAAHMGRGRRTARDAFSSQVTPRARQPQQHLCLHHTAADDTAPPTCVKHNVCPRPPGETVDHSAPHRKAQRLAEQAMRVQQL